MKILITILLVLFLGSCFSSKEDKISATETKDNKSQFVSSWSENWWWNWEPLEQTGDR